MQRTRMRAWLKGGSPFIVIGLVSLLVVLPQLLNHSIILGVDSIFHFNRFYEAAMQIQHHNLSYFQSNYAFQQSGRIVTALYGPYLTYAIGWLLLHLGGWFKLELVLGFALEFIAGSGMYVLGRKLRASRFWATSMALVFMLAGWVPTWLTTQEFMAWGAALMPWVLIQGVRMVQNRSNPIGVLPLAFSMAILVQTHALSSLLVCVALVPFAVVGFVRTTNRWRFAGHFMLAVGLTLLLTANVWGALLEVFGTNHVMAPYMPLNSGTYTSKLSFGSYGRGTLGGSLGLVCTVLFCAEIISLLLRRHRELMETLLAGVGTVFLLLASPLVPWNRIVAKWNVVGSFLQFPSRFAAVAAVLLLAALGMGLTHLSGELAKFKPHDLLQRALRLSIVFGVVLLAYQTVSDVARSAEAWNKPQVLQSTASVTLSADDMQEVRTAFMSPDLAAGLSMVAKGTPDYLPVPSESWQWFQDNSQYRLYHDQLVALTTSKTAEPGQIGKKIDKAAYKLYNQLLDEASPYAIYYQQITQRNAKYRKTVLSGGKLRVSWTAKKRDVVQIPAVAYENTRVWLNGKLLHRSDYDRSDIGAIITAQHKGTNVIELQYRESARTRFLLLLAPLAWIGLLIVAAWYWWRKRRMAVRTN
ncbi:hypothetical protein [Lacticaseibacillus songhuajiangensis]|uniref:hypothetical protein n=1 Tax=Lacticaseibacillus songhuajiangensis TaxID=1296539 RepID=UPI000F795BD1|nr:hypothetical protein [Lacticaseibacillus songhuajiangensis]